jgi:hypothetical protein
MPQLARLAMRPRGLGTPKLVTVSVPFEFRRKSMPETVVHFQIRMPPVLHEQLASWAKEDKASLNALIVGILEKAIEQHEGGTKTATKE